MGVWTQFELLRFRVGFRELDMLGNDAADEAADFGRRRVGNSVIDARRNLSGVCGRWYSVILDLHRFFIATSRAVVNHGGRDGTVPDPLVWSAGALPKRRRLVHAVREHSCPGHLVSGARIGSLCFLLLFLLRTLLIGPTLLVFWLNGLPFWVLCIGLPVVLILGLVAFHMWSYSFFMSIGLVRGCLWKRLILDICGQDAQFQCRLFRLVQALIFGAPVVSWCHDEVSLFAAFRAR